MRKSITTAVKNLHEHLLTHDIVSAAVEEGDVELLNCLPEKYLTPDLIFSVIFSKNKEGHYFSSFNLERIPLSARTKEVCLVAVKDNLGNFPHVPIEHRGAELLEILVGSAQKTMHLISQMPADAWSYEHAITGIKSIISSSYRSNYTPRSHRYTGQTYLASAAVESIQIFLSLVPAKYKTRKLYMEFFKFKPLSSEDVSFLIPSKYKQHDYYLTLAKIDFSLVPESRYSYEHFILALGPDSKMSIHSFEKNEKVRMRIFELMDDTMADLILDKSPSFFPELPKKFRTTKRLKKALEKYSGNSYWRGWVRKEDRLLLTPTVCRLFVKKGFDLPECMPQVIWNAEFVDYCIENGRPYVWLDKMPKELMTQKLADYLINYNGHYITDIPQEFITYDHAVQVHREYLKDNKLEQIENYIPPHYYREFTRETGLPKEFFGGEVSLQALRENRGKYTYCKLGKSYLGIYCTGRWQNEAYRIVLTRHSSGSIYPQQVFDKVVQTFHVTWLEKLIADNDPQYQKPAIRKDLKELLINPYYTLVEDCCYQNFTIFRNVLLGGTANYAVSLNGSVVFETSLDDLKETIDEYLK